MLTQELKNKVKELWKKFWEGGITNPLNAIEQITYLLFLKQIDENDKKNISNADFLGNNYKSIFTGMYFAPGADTSKDENGVDKETLRWGSFTRLPADDMYSLVQSKVFPFIKDLDDGNSFFTKHMQNAVLLIPSSRMLNEAIKKIDEIFDALQKEDRYIDALGDVYEELLDELKSAGKNGQFRTPTHIIELMVELLEPKIDDKIADPASGTAGFLLACYKYIITQLTSPQYRSPDSNGFNRGTLADKLTDPVLKTKLESETFYGFDIDPTMIRIGLMNLMMHGITQPKIDYKDTLSKSYNEDNIYNIVLANPPFTGNIDKEDLNESFTINTTKSELLFVERIYKMLKMGGTAGVVVPQGVLFGGGKAFIEIRKLIIEKCELKAVIAMPSGVFRPYAGVATAILIFTKGGETKNVWFYEMKNDGRSLDDKRTELKLPSGERDFGDLNSIIREYKRKGKNSNREKQHFLIPKIEIAQNNYDLSISKYKTEIYEEAVYKSPTEILKQLSSIENEILDGIEDLKLLLK
jgi:Type I restriction-modification system methyltransferase subunit